MNRAEVERRSAVLLTYLSGRPRLLLGLVAALLLGGAVFGPVWLAAPLGLLIVVVLVWLAYLAWPVLDPAGRGLRVVAVALLSVALVLRLT